MKTLLYLHQYFKFPNETGGTRSYDLATSFVKNGIDVVVISSTSNIIYKTNKRWHQISQDGLCVHYIYLPYDNQLSYYNRIKVFFQFLWFASFKLLRLKGDVVLATSTPLTIGIPALIKKLVDQTPYVFEVRDVWPEAVIAIGAIKNKIIQKILYSLEKLIYKKANAIVPLSVDMKESIDSRFSRFSDKTNIVIENIAEITRFQNESNTIDLNKFIGFEPRFSVLYAGTFGKVNGIHKIVELAKKTLFLDDNLVYILIGSGSEYKFVKQLASEYNVLNKNVFFIDPISKGELPKWYKAVSMGSSFVVDIPELWRNSAQKFFDTLAASKPVLINHEGWQADTIRLMNVGYVLPVVITDETAIKFVEYTKDHLLIEKQNKFALDLAINKYSLEVATNNYLKVFDKL